jgi:hypothetical protein
MRCLLVSFKIAFPDHDLVSVKFSTNTVNKKHALPYIVQRYGVRQSSAGQYAVSHLYQTRSESYTFYYKFFIHVKKGQFGSYQVSSVSIKYPNENIIRWRLYCLNILKIIECNGKIRE